MGEDDLIDEHVRRAVDELTKAVAGQSGGLALPRLWAAEQLRRATARYIDELITEARRGRWEGRTTAHTWEEIGAVLGISAQGARQRLMRQRRPSTAPWTGSSR